MSDWAAVFDAWPLIVAVAGLWARVEVALAGAKSEARYAREEAEKLDREIKTLRETMQKQGAVAGDQAVQLGRIEEAVASIASTLVRLEKRMDDERH